MIQREPFQEQADSMRNVCLHYSLTDSYRIHVGPKVQVFRTVATQKFHVAFIHERHCNSAWLMLTGEYDLTSKRDYKQHNSAENQAEDAR